MAFENSTIRFLYDDQVRDCPTISSQHGNTQPLNNLRDQLQATQWLGITASNQTYITMDFGSGNTATADAFALFNHSLGDLESATLKVGTADNGSTFDVTCASWTGNATEAGRDIVMEFPSQYSKRYWRVYFAEAGSMLIGEMLLGKLATFAAGISRPWDYGYVPNVGVHKSPATATKHRYAIGDDFATWSIPAGEISQTDWETLKAMWDAQDGPLWPLTFTVGAADSTRMGTGSGYLDPDFVMLKELFLPNSWYLPLRHKTEIVLQDLLE